MATSRHRFRQKLDAKQQYRLPRCDRCCYLVNVRPNGRGPGGGGGGGGGSGGSWWREKPRRTELAMKVDRAAASGSPGKRGSVSIKRQSTLHRASHKAVAPRIVFPCGAREKSCVVRTDCRCTVRAARFFQSLASQPVGSLVRPVGAYRKSRRFFFAGGFLAEESGREQLGS